VSDSHHIDDGSRPRLTNSILGLPLVAYGQRAVFDLFVFPVVQQMVRPQAFLLTMMSVLPLVGGTGRRP
jgi:hypothetical protein